MRIYLPIALVALLLPLQGRPSLDELSGPLTVKTYQVQKIYGHHLGYRVDLITDYGTLETIYVKNSWLTDPEVKRSELIGDVVLQQRVPSYMSVYYREGRAVRFIVYVQKTFSGRNMIIPAMETDATDANFDVTSLEISGGAPSGAHL